MLPRTEPLIAMRARTSPFIDAAAARSAALRCVERAMLGDVKGAWAARSLSHRAPSPRAPSPRPHRLCGAGSARHAATSNHDPDARKIVLVRTVPPVVPGAASSAAGG